MRKIDKGAER